MTRKQQVYHVAHLVHVCRNEKCLLNSVSERIKLVYRINLLGTAFKKKNKLPFKLLKPQFIGRILPN